MQDFLYQNRYIISGTHDYNDHYFMLDNYNADFTVPASYTLIIPNAGVPLYWRLNGAHTVAAGWGMTLAQVCRLHSRSCPWVPDQPGRVHHFTYLYR